MSRIMDALRTLFGARTDIAAAPPGVVSLWANASTGLGYGAVDRTQAHLPGSITILDDVTLAALWLGDPLVSTIVGAIVDDVMRECFEVEYRGSVPSDEELVEEVGDHMVWLGAEEKARLVSKSARAFGSAYLLPVINGGQGILEEPVGAVASVDGLLIVDKRDLSVDVWGMQSPEVFRWTPTARDAVVMRRVHQSHLVAFDSLDTPPRDRVELFGGFGRSVIQPVWETVRDFRQSWQSAVAMMQNGSQLILALPGLAQALLQAGGASMLDARLQDLQTRQWVGRMMPIDAGTNSYPSERLEWVERGFAGIADLLRQHLPLVAQAADMPITRLFGESPGGLNSTGKGEEKNWLSSVAAWRRSKITPPLERIVRMIAESYGATDPLRWGIRWPPLEALTSRERAELEQITAATDLSRVALGMPEVAILEHRYGGPEYDPTPPSITAADLALMGEVKAAEGLAPADPALPAPPTEQPIS